MKIEVETYRSVIRHARAAWPYECCGILLAGKGSPGLVSMIMPSANADREAPESRYRLDHRVQLLALEIEKSGVAQVAGYYHSHPDADPCFSDQDVQDAVEGTLYVIVGGGHSEPRVRAWRTNGAGPIEEPLEVEKGPWAK